MTQQNAESRFKEKLIAGLPSSLIDLVFALQTV